MFTRCLSCDASLGSNELIPHLPVGRKIVFDPERGRIWVVCPRCQRWNLTPLEERWEALAECESRFAQAEDHAGNREIAIAQAPGQPELVRIGGDARPGDIANYRYSQRLNWRRTRLDLVLIVVSLLAFVGVLWVLQSSIGAIVVAAWAAVVLAHYSKSIQRILPWLTALRVAARVRDGSGRRVTMRNWQVRGLAIDVTGEVGLGGRIWGREFRWDGRAAVELLANLLPRINWKAGDPGAIRKAAHLASKAEHLIGGEAACLRLLQEHAGRRLLSLSTIDLLALEMTATEGQELRMLRGEALALGLQWKREEPIGSIADNLLVPEFVTEWIERWKRRSRDRTKGRTDSTDLG